MPAKIEPSPDGIITFIKPKIEQNDDRSTDEISRDQKDVANIPGSSGNPENGDLSMKTIMEGSKPSTSCSINGIPQMN